MDQLVQLLLLQPKVSKVRPEPTAYGKLLSDPYILITAGAIWFSNLAFSMLEPSLPLWMIENWGSSSAEQGMAFLPSSLAYMIGTNMFGFVSGYFGRWQCSFAGFLMIGICALIIPFAQNIYHLIIPNAVLGLGLGLVDTNMFPMLGHIADLRHTNVYGSVYAIGDGAACLAFASGPFMAGPIVRYFGFRSMMAVMAIANLGFAPFMFIIKRLPETLDEKPKKRSVISIIETTPEYIKN
ncbi:unnamed protein product [Bursaphelenchus okinawaensis]|uniref:Major facilitator superfamily (MFS) profile domain-containing protein n=1 Tax=Bursaphelenchus okinawaensis TaxID=465554 RepID=A0A811LRJ9_9BILA|nr:unnamed protein product [Bursaphelenchus okinawaensis]CAG9128381.1 unnamed protein product [Bursaphelenchus okinawaensis]